MLQFSCSFAFFEELTTAADGFGRKFGNRACSDYFFCRVELCRLCERVALTVVTRFTVL